MKKRLLIGIVLLALAASALAAYAAWDYGDQPAFSFAVIGDTRPPHSKDVYSQPPNFFKQIRTINLLSYDLVVDNGDLILGYQKQADIINKMWDAFDKAAAYFTVPLRLVCGNHDVWDAQSRDIWLKRYGPLYYSFDHKGSHFIVLCSEIPGEMNQITGAQLAWLKKELARHKKAQHCFVFVHKPLWHMKDTNWWADVQPLLGRYHVDCVFGAHEHHYLKDRTVDGVRYYVTGGGGAEIGRHPELGDFYHFLHVVVRPKDVQISIIMLDYGFQRDDLVTIEKLEAFNKLLATLKSVSYDWSKGAGPQQVELTLVNPLFLPLTCKFAWSPASLAGWKVTPQYREVTLLPKLPVKMTFTLEPLSDAPAGKPEYRAELYCQGQGLRGFNQQLVQKGK